MLSAFKNFLITFLVGALLFGIIGFITTNFVSGVISGILDGEKEQLEGIINETPVDTNTVPDIPEPPVDTEKVPDGESFTAVFVGTDFNPTKYEDYFVNEQYLSDSVSKVEKDKDSVGVLSTNLRYISATWIVLLRADKEAREFALCYFTPETLVSVPTGSATLGEVYGRYGMDILCEYLNTMTGLDVDYRFVLDDVNAKQFLEDMGAVDFELPCDIYSGGKYHVSAEYKDELDPSATVTPFTSPFTENAEAGKGDKDKEEETTKRSEDEPAETESSEKNTSVLGKGAQTLTSYSVSILNTFKEFSFEDISTKSGYIAELLRKYLDKYADMSVEEATEAFKKLSGESVYTFADPYDEKSVIGTDLTEEKQKNFHSMLDALEYFAYTQFVYPGSYSEDTNLYTPDVKVGHEMFARYDIKPAEAETDVQG